ncbi:hypothetical protein KI387_035925 [Taxus chinensis]|uniref:SHSP domain-containing protein n=1 Tax=Taxus chinensis TaxID=29808 RepID=A0AA38KRC6_TAXCH|nr:hypothetical protein KI387_035925 [Taxus chinensis]
MCGDPFQAFNSSILAGPSSTDLARDTTAVANTQIDSKETPQAHIFKADLPGLKKEEVKIEVEEGRSLQISGERSKEEEHKNDNITVWKIPLAIQVSEECEGGGAESGHGKQSADCDSAQAI